MIGARLRAPALDPGRSRDRQPYYRIPRIRSLPYSGNAMVVYDIGPLRAGGLGTPASPLANIAQTRGTDPHSLTSAAPAAFLQFSEFLKLGGTFIDTWSGRPCYAAGWAGPP